MQIATERLEDGRWRWVTFEVIDGVLRHVGLSLVTFATQADAQRDLDASVNGKVDDTGRVVRTKADIDWLISTLIGTAQPCAGVTIGRVYWHPRDATGNNWDLAIVKDGSWKACLAEVEPTIHGLRSEFSIPDEG